MMYDPDLSDLNSDRNQEWDSLLSRLDACDLSEWDRDFVDTQTKRLALFGDRFVLSAIQQAQLGRMEKRYDCEKRP